MSEASTHRSGFSAAGGHGFTVGAVLRTWTAELTRRGVEEAGADVRRLVAAALGISHARLVAEPERVVTPDETAILGGYLARRAGREPVSRILGEREFYGRSFILSPATLDPRPDTETVVGAALEIAGEEGRKERPGLRILDVGTGTGCLLLTLLCELDGAHGTGTDISPEAIAVARVNAGRLGIAERASWLTADALETVTGPVHMLVSNPPYIRTGDIAHLDAEVRCFDPAIALDGGPDGLVFYRRLSAGITRVVPDGWAILEVGFDQADAVAAILKDELGPALADLRLYRDVAGKKRCVAVKTRARAYA
jgi:release factor glutamine methyltransferase